MASYWNSWRGLAIINRTLPCGCSPSLLFIAYMPPISTLVDWQYSCVDSLWPRFRYRMFKEYEANLRVDHDRPGHGMQNLGSHQFYCRLDHPIECAWWLLIFVFIHSAHDIHKHRCGLAVLMCLPRSSQDLGPEC